MKQPRRRTTRSLAFALVFAVLGGGCVSVLGLSSDRYMDSAAAATVLCQQFTAVCAGLVDPTVIWGPSAASCQGVISHDLENGVMPADLTACFTTATCHDLMSCLDKGHVTFLITSACSGCLCLDVCTDPAACRPWLCAPSSLCTATADAGVPGTDAGPARYCTP